MGRKTWSKEPRCSRCEVMRDSKNLDPDKEKHKTAEIVCFLFEKKKISHGRKHKYGIKKKKEKTWAWKKFEVCFQIRSQRDRWRRSRDEKTEQIWIYFLAGTAAGRHWDLDGGCRLAGHWEGHGGEAFSRRAGEIEVLLLRSGWWEILLGE